MKLPFGELVAMIRGMWRGHYPHFVCRGGHENRIPVFNYHRVESEEFDRHLIHLRRNGYSTLTADEHLDRIGNQDAGREVVLTFDDGHKSLYSVAYPLLEKYGFRAVAFLASEWIGSPGMITWDQAVEMHDSGVIDFQSHSSRHASIFVSSERTGFFSGGHGISPRWHVPWDVPMVRRDGTDRLLGPDDLGVPLYGSDSRMSDSRRYFPDPAVAEACRAVLEKENVDRILLEKDREVLLERVVRSLAGEKSDDRFEHEDEQREAIQKELATSKRVIEERLPGKKVRHFAFPWNRQGRVAEELLPECGYASAFAGLYTGEGQYRPDRQVYRLCRVNGDFLPRLPGTGRKSLIEIVTFKTTRRVTRGRPYW